MNTELLNQVQHDSGLSQSAKKKNVKPSQTDENTGRTLNCAINLFDQTPASRYKSGHLQSSLKKDQLAHTGREKKTSVSVFCAGIGVLRQVFPCRVSYASCDCVRTFIMALRGCVWTRHRWDREVMGGPTERKLIWTSFSRSFMTQRTERNYFFFSFLVKLNSFLNFSLLFLIVSRPEKR